MSRPTKHGSLRAMPDDGPCYDLCFCRRCWRGWSDLSYRSKLRHRIAYIWRVNFRRQQW